MAGRHGLGNGYAALTAAGLVLELQQGGLHATATTALVLAATGLVAGATWAMLRVRIGTAAVPTSGLVPLGWAPALLWLVTLTSLVGVRWPRALDAILAPSTWTHHVAHLVALALVTVALTALFSRRPWQRATIVTVGYLVLLYVVAAFTSANAPRTLIALTVPTVAMATAWLMDLVAEWRARRVHVLVPIGPLHHTAAADATAVALAAAGIPAHLRGRHQRQLAQAFAPWLPIEVLVAPADAERARALVWPA